MFASGPLIAIWHNGTRLASINNTICSKEKAIFLFAITSLDERLLLDCWDVPKIALDSKRSAIGSCQ